MNLSSEIQHHLKNLTSSIVLGRRFDGSVPNDCAFAGSNNREILVTPYRQYFAITFTEKEFCFGRFLTSDTLILAQSIDLWLGHKVTAEILKTNIKAVEIFLPFDVDKTIDKKLQKQWNRVKNFFFANEYFSDTLHFDICMKILEVAKADIVLKNLVPYSSLGRICFSKRIKRFSEYLCIAPNRWENINEAYFLNLPPDSRQIHINNLDEALQVIKDHVDNLNELID